PEQSVDLTPEDLKYIDEFTQAIKDITSDFENYRFHLAAEKIYHYFWHTFADIIIEKSKDKLKNSDQAQQDSTKWMLRYILRNSLITLHPFMPFVTEEIWGMIPKETSMLIIEKWPEVN